MAGTEAFDTAITQTTGAAEGAAPADRWPWLFARCWLHLERHQRTGDAGELDAATADFRLLPSTADGAPRLAAALVEANVRGGRLDVEHVEELVALVAVADEDPGPRPDWARPRAAVRALGLARSLQVGAAGVDSRSVLAQLPDLVRDAGGVEPFATAVDSARIVAEHLIATQDRDLAKLRKLAEEAAGRAQDAVGTPVDVQARMLAIGAAAQEAISRGDVVTAMARFDEMAAMRDQLPPGHMLRAALDEAMSSMAMLRGMFGGAAPAAPFGRPTEAIVDPLAELRHRAARTDLSPAQRAMNLCELGMNELVVAEANHRPADLDAAVGHLRDAADTAPGDDPQRPYYLMSCAGALVRRHEILAANRMAGRGDLDEAVTLLEEGRAEMGGPAHPLWSTSGEILAEAHRFAGRHAAARDTARDGLRGNLWGVLLQSDTAAADDAVRDAAGDAVALARLYLEACDPAGATSALDAGRGLILLSAMRFGDAAARLDRLGRPELAAEWRADGAEGSSVNLRRQVVTALLDARPEPGAPPFTLDPPDVHELRAALTRTGADAVVYLVPPDDDGPGVAVVVPTVDEPSTCPLPKLDPRGSGPVDRYLAATRRQDARDIATDLPAGQVDSSGPDLHDAVTDVVDWAWTAATGPVLDHLADHHGLSPDRLPRVVLVPLGVLGRIPWHAAAEIVGGRRRYAVERAVFSYAVSARMFCDVAFSSDIDRGTGGLVLGDPGAGTRRLQGARREAQAIRRAFLPGATYLGRADGSTKCAGAGTVAEVAAWLVDDRPAAGAILHAACHGTVRPGRGARPTSFLQLADGPLTAEALIGSLAARPARGLALAILAACSSGVPGRGHDEAFSVATAFLAAGTRSVVSSLWTVPDAATSVLMFMFHHYLRDHAPVDALHAAQLWMLDPDAAPPESMPDDLLAGRDASEILAWAGFTHAGR